MFFENAVKIGVGWLDVPRILLIHTPFKFIKVIDTINFIQLFLNFITDNQS